jgi:methane monooxygenase component A gamma chain
MRKPKTRRPLGAEWRTDASPFGNTALRDEWVARIRGYVSLGDAMAALIALRDEKATSVADMDALWIEARLEERVAVLRFDELSYQELRTETLTGERIVEVQARYEAAAKTADPIELERLAAEFRRKFKPPIMPTSPFMQTEIVLSEQLMKRRSLRWFDPTIADLRNRRGATVVKEGWGDPTASTPGNI